jgi:hypothetical protein
MTAKAPPFPGIPLFGPDSHDIAPAQTFSLLFVRQYRWLARGAPHLLIEETRWPGFREETS